MTTRMSEEIAEIPAVVERLLTDGDAVFGTVGGELARRDPALAVTIARGSSDHAASFFKYACELVHGVPVASIGPSVASIYGAPLKLERAAAIAISQSGRSPDIVALLENSLSGGAYGIAITNDPDSPLAGKASAVVPLLAGPERSVAATKTFAASLVAGLAIVAHWSGDAGLLGALRALPERLRDASIPDWTALEAPLKDAESIFVLGRGPVAAIAAEAALKFKETCGLHAEAYSTAEVLHGPSAIVRERFPVLALAVDDAAHASVVETCRRLEGQGASIYLAGRSEGVGTALPFASTGHPLTDAVSLVVAFYGFVEALARRRGRDPDRPPHLRKVTATV